MSLWRVIGTPSKSMYLHSWSVWLNCASLPEIRSNPFITVTTDHCAVCPISPLNKQIQMIITIYSLFAHANQAGMLNNCDSLRKQQKSTKEIFCRTISCGLNSVDYCPCAALTIIEIYTLFIFNLFGAIKKKKQNRRELFLIIEQHFWEGNRVHATTCIRHTAVLRTNIQIYKMIIRNGNWVLHTTQTHTPYTCHWIVIHNGPCAYGWQQQQQQVQNGNHQDTHTQWCACAHWCNVTLRYRTRPARAKKMGREIQIAQNDSYAHWEQEGEQERAHQPKKKNTPQCKYKGKSCRQEEEKRSQNHALRTHTQVKHRTYLYLMNNHTKRHTTHTYSCIYSNSKA